MKGILFYTASVYINSHESGRVFLNTYTINSIHTDRNFEARDRNLVNGIIRRR
jgi:hypothetical protein